MIDIFFQLYIYFPFYQTVNDCFLFSLFIIISIEEHPVEYWQVLAERRRLALAEALSENEEVLHLQLKCFWI